MSILKFTIWGNIFPIFVLNKFLNYLVGEYGDIQKFINHILWGCGGGSDGIGEEQLNNLFLGRVGRKGPKKIVRGDCVLLTRFSTKKQRKLSYP